MTYLGGVRFETISASGGHGAVLVANLTRPSLHGVSVRVIGSPGRSSLVRCQTTPPSLSASAILSSILFLSSAASKGITAPVLTLVPYQPVKAEHIHQFIELGKIHRLDQVTVGVAFVGFGYIRFGGRGRQDDHGDAHQVGVGLDDFQHLQAVHLGQAQVEQDQVGPG